jgi:hypothetical protein
MIKSYLYFLLLLTGIVSCRKENTSWTSSWSFPIIKDQLSLKDIAGDTLLFNDSSGCKLVYEKTLYRVNLSEYLKIPDTTISSELTINFPSLNINPGTILSQTNVENEINIGDAQLKVIHVKKGKITIVLKNPLTTKTYYTIEIPSFTMDGVPVKQLLVAEKGSANNPTSISSSLDLSGYTIDLRGVDNSKFNTIVTNFDMQLDPKGTVTKVSNKDITIMDINISDIQLDYAQGYFGNLSINSSYEVPIKSFTNITQGTIDFSKAEIDLSIINSCKLMAKGKISTLSSYNSSKTTSINFQNIQVNNPFFIAPAQGDNTNLIPSTKKFILNESNSNLIPFLQNFGDQYKVNYSFELNPYGNLNGGWDEFYPESEISLALKTILPLSFNAKNLTIQDTFSLDLTSLNKNHLLKSGKIKLQTENSFPIDSKITLYFLNENNKIIETIDGTSVIQGKSKLTTESKLSTIYLIPSSSFFVNSSLIRKVIVKVVFNSLSNDYEIPYNGELNFKLSGDFTTKMSY